MVNKKKQARKTFQLGDLYTYLLLLVVSVLVRIPFLKTYDMVTYDGTYYINHAKTFLGIMNSPSGFPIGYPMFITLFMALIHDGARAAQTVSFLAGLGSLFVFYSLAKRFVRRSCALVAAFILALTPLFIALSMLTLSESIYLFWVLLGLLFFAKDRDVLSGLFLGMAAITRPEALGIIGILSLLRLRRPKKLLSMISGFAIVYCLNVAAQSSTAGKLILVPKTGFFGTSATFWRLREAWIDFPGKESVLDEISKENATVLTDYFKRMPRELLLLVRHVSPVVFLLSLYGMIRKRLFLLAALAPFIPYPLFTVRSEARYIFPYVPVFILYSFIALERFRDRRVYRTAAALLILSAASGVFINRAQLTVPILPGSEWAKDAATYLKGTIKPGARIADRDPFLAFYLEGTYVEIPIAPLDETLEHLATHDTDYLVLHKGRIGGLRPTLTPLLYDRAVIAGEMRFAQHSIYSDFVIIYKRTAGSEPAKERYLVPPRDGEISGLSWSPDGRSIAYCLRETSGISNIHSISPDGGPSRIIVADLNVDGQISWAPDSKRIAFESKRGSNTSIFVSNESGDARRITSHPGTDAAPFWSSDGKKIVFCSDLSGRYEVWLKNLDTGDLKQITANGGNIFPTMSSDRRYLSWIRRGEGIFILERRTGILSRVELPKRTSSPPSWSPDGKLIAVAGADWGKTDIYLVTPDGRNAALLTRSSSVMMSLPCWSPDGQALAVATLQDYKVGIAILTGIQRYRDRLMNPEPIAVLEPIK